MQCLNSEFHGRSDKQIAVKLKMNQGTHISKEPVHHTIADTLGWKKVSERWLLHLLTQELKAQTELTCTKSKPMIKVEESYLDMTRVHHYDLANLLKPTEYRHKDSTKPRSLTLCPC